MNEILSKAIAEKVVTIPVHVELPAGRLDYKDPLVKGDVVEFVLRVNGVDAVAMKHEVTVDAAEGNEIRAMLTFSLNEMTAFPKGEGAAPVREVLVSSGELKAVEAEPIEEIKIG